MKIHLFSLLTLLLWGCNNSGSKNNGESQKSPETVQEKQVGEFEITTPSCYLFATDRDTVYLKLYPSANGKVMGDLNYFFYERDGNTGQIEGEIQGDILIADYTFQSEGLTSVREVAFLLGKDQVTEGYGDVKEKDGRMVFWHKDSLDFSNGLVMPKAPCEQLE